MYVKAFCDSGGSETGRHETGGRIEVWRWVTGAEFNADGLSLDGGRPALHLPSSQINNRREQ